jgi:hypothetical protein
MVVLGQEDQGRLWASHELLGGEEIRAGEKIGEGGSSEDFMSGKERKKEGGEGLGWWPRGGRDGGGMATVEEGGLVGSRTRPRRRWVERRERVLGRNRRGGGGNRSPKCAPRAIVLGGGDDLIQNLTSNGFK